MLRHSQGGPARSNARWASWLDHRSASRSEPHAERLEVVELDAAHHGKDGEPLVKYNPLANVSLEYVWDSLRGFEVPNNELHAKGYVSIGCEPCTRAVMPGQHEREGRWWWERASDKECGLHTRAK